MCIKKSTTPAVRHEIGIGVVGKVTNLQKERVSLLCRRRHFMCFALAITNNSHEEYTQARMSSCWDFWRDKKSFLCRHRTRFKPRLVFVENKKRRAKTTSSNVL